METIAQRDERVNGAAQDERMAKMQAEIDAQLALFGDTPGHEFHGNQHTGGMGSGEHASHTNEKAEAATTRATSAAGHAFEVHGAKGSHEKAIKKAHSDAADAHETAAHAHLAAAKIATNPAAVQHHLNAVAFHKAEAKNHRGEA